MLENLYVINKRDVEYLNGTPKEQWARLYDGGLRNEYMITNLMECINFVLNGTRHLPIMSVVKETYFHLSSLFPKRSKKIVRQIKSGHIQCKEVMKDIIKNAKIVNSIFSVYHSFQMIFQVTEIHRLNKGIIEDRIVYT